MAVYRLPDSSGNAPEFDNLALSAQQRWEAESLGAHRADACQAMLAALSQPTVTGKRHNYLDEPGETWAFYFTFGSHQFYGKICLKNNRLIVKILSAHKPNPSARKP